MLEVRDLCVSYGQVAALDGVAMQVGEGEAVCLLGSNGAGKSTFIRSVMGFVRPARGEIAFGDTLLHKRPPEDRSRLGISAVFEGRGMLADMTVRDNLLMGAYLRPKSTVIDEIDRVYSRFPRLRDLQGRLAGTLSGGEQQMVAIGRALMAGPKIILMDEPSMGLAPIIVEQVFDIIADIVGQGIALVLVEQNVHMALAVCQRFYVLGKGRIALSGSVRNGRLISAVDGSEMEEDQLEVAYLGG